jgi:hypothetical protein
VSDKDYIARIREAWPREGEAGPELLHLAEEAVSKCRASPELWVMRGNLIQLSEQDSPYKLRDALLSYERALLVDSRCAEALQEIGYYFDVIDEDLPRVEAAFRRAIDCGGGEQSHVGMARVLAELGKRDEGERVLAKARTIFGATTGIQRMEHELGAGYWHRD